MLVKMPLHVCLDFFFKMSSKRMLKRRLLHLHIVSMDTLWKANNNCTRKKERKKVSSIDASCFQMSIPHATSVLFVNIYKEC